MNRMNKEQLISLIESVKIDKSEFWLLSSSSLVMRNIFPDAGDLDIAVTEKGLEQLKQNYNLISKGNGFYIVTDNVECVCDGEIEKLEYKPELINGYLCQNIYEYLNYLKSSDREKDKLRIPIVEEYINNLKNASPKTINRSKRTYTNTIIRKR